MAVLVEKLKTALFLFKRISASTYPRACTQLRGGYYPRIFYPGLYNAKERFLKNFETMYYLKALPGGWIFRKAPEDWQVNFSCMQASPALLCRKPPPHPSVGRFARRTLIDVV